jgi:hypothetical protein
MTNRVGLWIDHKRAVIVSVSEQGETVQTIESGAKRIEYRGGARSRAAYSARYTQGEDQLDNRFTEQLNKYYDEVAALLRGAMDVLVMGPGEARTEFKARLEREKGPAREIRVEPADKLTERQIIARVRKHYKLKPSRA